MLYSPATIVPPVKLARAPASCPFSPAATALRRRVCGRSQLNLPQSTTTSSTGGVVLWEGGTRGVAPGNRLWGSSYRRGV